MGRAQELNRQPNVQRRPRQAAWLPLALLLALVVPGTVLGQGGVRVYLVPADPILVTSQPVSVDVVAEGVRDLVGAEVHLRFDRAMLRMEDADPLQVGAQLAPGSLLDPAHSIVLANQLDNEAGTADFAVILVDSALPVQGNGVIASLILVPLQAGMLRLDLENVKLITRDLQAMEVGLSGLNLPVVDQAGAPSSGDQPTAIATPLNTLGQTPPLRGAPIWMLVVLALALVLIPLASLWFISVGEVGRPPRSNQSDGFGQT